MPHAFDALEAFTRFVWLPLVGLFSVALIVFRRRWAKRAKWLFDHRLYLKAPSIGRSGPGWVSTTETMRRSLLWVGVFGLSVSLGSGAVALFPHAQLVLTVIMLALAIPSALIAVALATRRVTDDDDGPYIPRNDDGPERF